MASSTTSQIDPRRPGQYILKVGKALKGGSSSSTFSSVKYNHKPSLPNGDRVTKLSRTDSNDADLSIVDNEDGTWSKYKYKGQRGRSKTSYALIFNQEAQTCTLEPVKSSFTFNITSTPWEASQDKLSKQYEQLQVEASTVADGTLDGDPDEEPDPDNPFDFRHYIKSSAKSHAMSLSPSPALQPTKTAGTHSLTPSKARDNVDVKPKAKAVSKVDPLRQAPRKSAGKVIDQPTPTVRLERKASTHHSDKVERNAAKSSRSSKASAKNLSEEFVHSSSDEDNVADSKHGLPMSGGLEIDMGNPPPKVQKPKSRILHVPLQSSPHTGPISLHSAANSPMGRMVVPHQQPKRKQTYEQDVIDFGASDDADEDEGEDEEPSQQSYASAKGQDLVMQDADLSEEEGDDDVEPMILGSPAHMPLPETTPPEPDVDVDFDDDAFEAQMMEAMLGEDDEEEVHARQDESESESEAE